MIFKVPIRQITDSSMSTTCQCSVCTSQRQLGAVTANTTGWATGNPYYTPALAPPPPPPPPGIPPPVPQPPPPPLGVGLAYYTPNPFPHARVKWTPTPASRFVSKKQKPSLKSPKFKHTSFPNFIKLPPELRVRIWTLSAPESRVIELRTWKPALATSPLKISVGPHTVPSILHTSRESRLEGLRVYQLEEIGISLWKDYDPSELHIPWRYHHQNPYADPEYQVRPRSVPNGPYEVEKVMPYAPQRIYISYSRDTIYLGPEFSQTHLRDFLSSPTRFLELPGLQYLALDRKLWLRERDGTWNGLRNALYSLGGRPVKEVYIIPDDDRGALEDRWYYGKHSLVFREPLVEYEFIPAGQTEPAKGVVENLNEWFGRLWADLPGRQAESAEGRDAGNVESESGSGGEGGNVRRVVPKVGIKSVRRGGRQMSDYKDGVWDVQKNLGDMRRWKGWVPGEDG